jgi:hypothetical protein
LVASAKAGTLSCRHGFGYTAFYLHSLSRRYGEWALNYCSDRGRRSSIHVGELEDLFLLNHVRYDMAQQTELRKRENELLKKLVHKRRLPLTAKRWQELFLKKYRHEDPDPKELKRLLASEHRAARKRYKAARATKEAPKHEPETVVAAEPVGVVD